MKPTLISGAIALSMMIPGVALAADLPLASPPPPPPLVVDPITGFVTSILTPIGTVIGGVTQPITTVLSPPPPPPVR